MVFIQWIFFYTLPAIGAISLARSLRTPTQRALAIHAGIVLSIALVSFTGVRLDWNISLLSLGCLGASVCLSFYLLRTEGLTYALSSAVQEWCILLAGILLAPATGILIAAVLTALVFSLAHLMGPKEIGWKLPFTFGWGIVSILAYAGFHEPLLNIAIHASAGALLIHAGYMRGHYGNTPPQESKN